MGSNPFRRTIIFYMAGIAQLVRALGCGSRGRRFDPGYSPHFKIYRDMAKSVRHQILILACVGSSPAIPTTITQCVIYDPLAQLAEHLTFNQGVRSSNLRWLTKRFAYIGKCLCKSFSVFNLI